MSLFCESRLYPDNSLYPFMPKQLPSSCVGARLLPNPLALVLRLSAQSYQPKSLTAFVIVHILYAGALGGN